MKRKPPSPVDHPATAATLSVGGVAALLVIELKQRFGIDVSLDEAMLALTVVIAMYHFAQGKVKP